MSFRKELVKAVVGFLVVTAATILVDRLVSTKLAAVVFVIGICTLIFLHWEQLGLKRRPKSVQLIVPMILVFFVGIIGHLLYKPAPKLDIVEEVELAPFVVSYLKRHKVPGGESKGMRYGLAAILRIRTSPPTHVRRLDVVGDVSIDCAEYEDAFINDGELFGSYEEECVNCEPFIRISWVFWPPAQTSDQSSEEQFIRFLIKEPDYLGMRIMGTRFSDYIGCKSENQDPKILTTVPRLQDLIYFTAMGAPVEKGSQIKPLLGPRLKKEVEDGGVQFLVDLGSERITIPPEAIRRIRIISPRQWDTSLVQELFYATDPWNRVEPVAKDPLMEPR